MDFDFRPGVYRVSNAAGLLVRGTTTTETSGNLTGQKFTFGKTFPAYDIVPNSKGWLWAVITPSNIHTNQTLYVCLWDLNTSFAELISPFKDDMTNPVLAALLRIEAKIDELRK